MRELDDDLEMALRLLREGSFTRLGPYFEENGSYPSQIVAWHEEGRFAEHESELAEALTCAAFLGKTNVVEYLISKGVGVAAGNATGMTALHWAADRGQLDAVRLLLRSGADLEARNIYGGTSLGQTAWSAVQLPRAAHVAIFEELLKAGGDVDAVEFPTGHEGIDAVIRRHRAK